MSLIIAGERSGVGKTTVTLALLAALSRRYPQQIQAFKVGPDYIDPMFHTHVTGRPSRTLDPVLTSPDYVQTCYQYHASQTNYALIEGVMGLFDGVTGKSDWASTAHIARILDLPILLVLNCSSTSGSIAAIAHGYTNFDTRLTFAGVVLNRVGSDRHLELLKDALAPLNLPILGVLRRQTEIQIPDRHLGLVPTAELPALQTVIDYLAHLGETCFNWELLLPLCQTAMSPATAMSISPTQPAPEPAITPTIRLAVAHDQAFSFYYADNFDRLKQAGFELVNWSPLVDSGLPEAVQGLYFGGGFPEMFAAELSANKAAKTAVYQAIQAGMPTYAECGGLMYLCEHIIDFAGQAHPMVGILPSQAQMGKKLTLGYRQATAQVSTPLLQAGGVVWGHEFHRSSLLTEPTQPLYQLQNYDGTLQQPEGWQRHQVHASYIHIHFGNKLDQLKRFWQACQG